VEILNTFTCNILRGSLIIQPLLMRKNFYQISFWLSGLLILFILSGQSEKDIKEPQQNLPAEIVNRLDSLRDKDDLSEWLYAYREYVYADPARRISLLIDAQSSVWRPAKTDAERTEWFNCLTAQGYYLLYGGNILRSINAYEQAYRFYFDKPLPGTDVLEYVLKPLGNNYTRLGDYDRAIFIQEKSLALAEEKDSSQISSICHNLATTAIWKEDLPLAKQYCEKGLMQVKKNSPLHGLLLSTLSEVFLKSGQKDSAEINIKCAIRILTTYLDDKEEVNVAYWLRGAWQGLGDIQKEKDEPAAALVSYQKATTLINQYYKGQRTREKAQLSVLAGNMLLQLGQPEKAMERFNNALLLLIPAFQPQTIHELPARNYLYGENALADALHGKADCLKSLNKNDEALQCYMLMFSTARKLRKEFFSTTAKQQQQKENRCWAEAAISTAFELWKTSDKKEYADKVLLIAEMSKAQLLLDEMMTNLWFNSIKNNDSLLNKQRQMMQAITFYEKEAALNHATGKADNNTIAAKKELQFELSLIQKQVKEKYPLQEAFISDEELPSADSLLQQIPVGTTMVEFFTGEKNIYSIEAENGKVMQIRKIENADSVLLTVKNFVDTYFQQGQANMMNNPERYYKDAFAIYQTLWNDVASGKQENCMVIPDGILGYLPFDALVTDPDYKPAPDQWPFLVKKTNLFFSYSLQTVGQQKKMEYPARSFTGFFISFDSSSMASIPAVKKESEEIQNAIDGDFFLDREATLSTFNNQLAKVNLLHISTHSFLQGKENMPVIQLADDKFFLFELYGKTFRPQLVVLSACRTGHGMLAQGEGIISLARGFTSTGAAGIVAGLWDMNDEATATLMGIFYRQLAIEHKPATALHKVKLQWLQQKNEQQFQKLPYFWAGMVYSGDNCAVEMKQKKTLTDLWWIAAIIITGMVIYFRRRKKLHKVSP
jgi:CHAT domain-containing protein